MEITDSDAVFRFFLDDFVNKQEELDPQFKKVINDNFWDLIGETNKEEKDE